MLNKKWLVLLFVVASASHFQDTGCSLHYRQVPSELSSLSDQSTQNQDKIARSFAHGVLEARKL